MDSQVSVRSASSQSAVPPSMDAATKAEALTIEQKIEKTKKGLAKEAFAQGIIFQPHIEARLNKISKNR